MRDKKTSNIVQRLINGAPNNFWGSQKILLNSLSLTKWETLPIPVLIGPQSIDSKLKILKID